MAKIQRVKNRFYVYDSLIEKIKEKMADKGFRVLKENYLDKFYITLGRKVHPDTIKSHVTKENALL